MWLCLSLGLLLLLRLGLLVLALLGVLALFGVLALRRGLGSLLGRLHQGRDGLRTTIDVRAR